MARPRSEDKRNAILDAAARLIAERGLAATPTSAISRAAGVADGTLFTYFRTKDELVSELYLDIKRDMARGLLEGWPRHADAREQFRFFWDAYLDWGMANPERRRAMEQLQVAAQVSPQARAVGAAPFAEVAKFIRDSIARRVLRDYPVDYVGNCVATLAEMTLGYMSRDPGDKERYRQAGFDMLWNGMAYR